MAKRRRRRKSYIGQIIFSILLFIVVLLAAFVFLKKDNIKETVTKKVATTAIEQIIKAETGESVDIEEVKSQMNQEDAKSFDTIVEKYTDTDKVEECLDLYKSGGTSAVKEYVKDEVDTTDIDKLKELYDKYNDTINSSQN
ncbi:MAG: hypothetical protein PHS74_04560 [Lachnospiraceae bacterium]|nr:hypothetical protein [Lachnospiraceae bacterium]